MDIEEVKNKKRKLVSDLAKLLGDFAAETSVNVTQVHVHNVGVPEMGKIYDTQVLAGITLEFSL